MSLAKKGKPGNRTGHKNSIESIKKTIETKRQKRLLLFEKQKGD